jgi:hypothetical protein
MRRPQSTGTIQPGLDVFIASLLSCSGLSSLGTIMMIPLCSRCGAGRLERQADKDRCFLVPWAPLFRVRATVKTGESHVGRTLHVIVTVAPFQLLAAGFLRLDATPKGGAGFCILETPKIRIDH